MTFRADLHVHSAASPDGRDTLEAILAQARRQGLDAIAVCDHDLCTPAPEGDRPLCIPGTEVSTTDGHILGLFLKRPIPAWDGRPSGRDAIAAIHDCGGLAVLAHPFQRPGADADFAHTLPLDAIEGANARAPMKVPDANEKARALAGELGLPAVGGSDAHSAGELGSCYTELDAQALTLDALRQAVQDGRCRPVEVRICTWKLKAKSQWVKARRQGGLWRLCKGLAYLAIAPLRDCKARRRNKCP